MKKISLIFSAILLSMLMSFPVLASEKTVVALGKDLSEEQTDTVLGLMGITRADLENCTVIYVTNEDEHAYLDGLVDSSVIGTKALSSVLMREKEKGSGIVVTTKNINYCTTGMYRNALLTAGVEDAEVIVAAPTNISGTAALIGASKAYENLSGKDISKDLIRGALEELITTGELEGSNVNVSNEDIEALIAYVKDKEAAGKLNNEADIRAAILEGEQKFGVSLSEAERDKIVSLMNKLHGLGLNNDYLISQAEKLYQKYGSDIVNKADEAIEGAINDAVNEIVDRSVNSIIDNMTNSIKTFFKKIFDR